MLIDKIRSAVLVAVLTTAVGTLYVHPVAAQDDKADRQAVEQAVDQWFVVLNAMLNGDAKPFAELYSHADDVTYMGAEGTYRIGWAATWSDWQAQAKKSTGGTVEPVDVHIVVNGDLAAATHVTKGSVRKPDGEMAEAVVRESSVFRKEDGAWRMIGHHADGVPFWMEAFHR